MPITRWASLCATDATGVEFIAPMVRRRLSPLSRLALQVAHDCAGEYPALRMVFASRHGELGRTGALLDGIVAGEPMSPTAFGLSVLNAASGIFGIVRGDRSAATAISAGSETLGHALLEAHAQAATGPHDAPPVLLVYADEPANDRYAVHHDLPERDALAILSDARDVRGYLHCEMLEPGAAPASAAVFATQGEAIRQCLSARIPTTWHGDHALWRWSWHEHAA